MAQKTLFQKIADKEIPAAIVYEDEHCVAFRDIQPQAPVHILVVPRKPLLNLAASTPEDAELLGHLLGVVRQVAENEGLAAGGYRVVMNNGRDGGQSVDHLHIHVLGGRPLAWPPG